MTDPYLCVKGSHGTIFALGDASTIEQAHQLASVPSCVTSLHLLSLLKVL